eukprot:TRINITY_DN16450_c0_g2_i2.p2 TRINITY_DN16450_c0_g2~~TRINITY_DN16450_c0_g2_i2.p2  ORF type:complete len:121 (-),score=38.19 TRINITY_DN16450_c0_g2_i2:273-635(-)
MLMKSVDTPKSKTENRCSERDENLARSDRMSCFKEKDRSETNTLLGCKKYTPKPAIEERDAEGKDLEVLASTIEEDDEDKLKRLQYEDTYTSNKENHQTLESKDNANTVIFNERAAEANK